MPEERPGHILDAALDAFVENGFTATRLEDVAERAGISKGTLYLYFDSKEALLTALVRENIVPFIERTERRVDEFQGSSRDLLIEILREWWEGMLDSRAGGLPKLVLAEASNFPAVARIYFDEVVQRVRRLFAKALRRGIERGEFRAVDVDYAVRVIMAPVVMGVIWKHSLVQCQIDTIDFDRHHKAIIDLVLHGVANGPPRAAAVTRRGAS
jgi:AcrR family transcriptional regulator